MLKLAFPPIDSEGESDDGSITTTYPPKTRADICDARQEATITATDIHRRTSLVRPASTSRRVTFFCRNRTDETPNIMRSKI
jgi:hypothetical protein